MGGAPKYSKGRQRLRQMQDAAKHRKDGNVNVADGKGRYPKCLEFRPLGDLCPKEIPSDPLNVPKECKLCLEFLKSHFYSQKYMTKERRAEMFRKMGIPTEIEM